MSIIFGVCAFEDRPVEQAYMTELAASMERHGPDGTFIRVKRNVGMGFQACHTHERSNLETQPTINARGDMLTLDGRIDNYSELRGLLGLQADDCSDSKIVLAAFDRWGEECFPRLVGDWAIALWDRNNRALYLARDHAGTRTLYYEVRSDSVVWSTYLEAFFSDGLPRKLDETYAACYLGCQPIRDRTPYVGVSAVTPAHCFRFHGGKIVRKPHWDWMARNRIRYRSGTQYEEHFLSLFKQSVERRTGPGAPILAQLSGGMDSSSIVCMSDHLRNQNGVRPESLLDTVSFYDDSEQNWNERPYFEAVERARGKTGFHLAVSSTRQTYELPNPLTERCLWPGLSREAVERARDFECAIAGRGFRVMLSGIGGDEVLGGVPTSLPELADYLVSFRLVEFSRQSLRWCLSDRSPFVLRLRDVMAFAFRTYWQPGINLKRVPPWLNPSVSGACSAADAKDITRQHALGYMPSTLARGQTWWSILETVTTASIQLFPRYEFRFPYLDKDLVNFLFAIPPEQIQRPGRRRSLMRQALKGIVPLIVLERRRKAFINCSPRVALQQASQSIRRDLPFSPTVKVHAVQPRQFEGALDSLVKGTNVQWMTGVSRTIAFDLWMKSMAGFVQQESMRFDP